MYSSSSSNQHDLPYPTSDINPSINPPTSNINSLYPPIPNSGPKLGFEHLYTQPESFNNTSSSNFIVPQPTTPSSLKPSKPIPPPRTVPPARPIPLASTAPLPTPIPPAKNSPPRRKCQEIICKICNAKVTNNLYQSLGKNQSNFCYRCQHQSGNWNQPLISLKDPKTLHELVEANHIENLIANNIENLTEVDKCNECDNQIFEFVYTCTMCNCYYLCKKCEAHGKHPEHVLIGIPYNSDASNVNQTGPSTSTPNSNKTPPNKSKKHSTAKRFAEHFGITLAAKLALTGLMAAFGLEGLGDFLTDPGGGDGSMK